LVKKISVFYIALYVFVNMISGIGGIFRPRVPVWEFIDLQGFNPHAGS
jgi:hypothetical protein